MTYYLTSERFLNVARTCEVLKDVWKQIVKRWEQQHSITAGKHMQENMNIVPRCGEHSNGSMYVEHGAILALERWRVVVV